MFENMKLGRLPAIHDHHGLHLTTVVPDILKYEAPNQVRRFSEVPEWIIGDNDKIGDCSCVGIANSVLGRTTWAGHTTRTPTPDIIKFYENFGYNPSLTQPDGNNPTDQGAILVNVMRTWMTKGFNTGSGINKLKAYAAIDPRNFSLLKSSIMIFGDVYIGVDLTVAQQTQTIWSFVNTTPWGGHCVLLVGYDESYYYVISWGKVVKVEKSFIEQQCSEAYVLLDGDSITKGKQTFDSWNMDALTSAVHRLGGQF